MFLKELRKTAVLFLNQCSPGIDVQKNTNENHKLDKDSTDNINSINNL